MALVDIKIECRKIEIDIDSGTVDLQSVDLVEIIKSISRESSISEIMEELSNCVDYDYDGFVDWVNDQYDLFDFIAELSDDKKMEILEKLKTELNDG